MIPSNNVQTTASAAINLCIGMTSVSTLAFAGRVELHATATHYDWTERHVYQPFIGPAPRQPAPRRRTRSTAMSCKMHPVEETSLLILSAKIEPKRC